MAEITIRPIQEGDQQGWRRLFTAYLDFYKERIEEEIFTSTFKRFLSNDLWAPSCFVAVADGTLVGFVHYLYHAHCWRIKRVCYLQDLFAEASYRGQGIGRRLIERVYEQAEKDNAPTVYWFTEGENLDARKLYEKVATVSSFVKYQR
ncbi:MAG: GNAT family N-acetyltransferase [Pseudomonadota bacterium]